MNAKELFGHWDHVRRGLNEALDMLTDEQLAFVPREGLWSLGTVVCHIAGAEDGWMRCAMGPRLHEWPAGRFEPQDYTTVASLKTLLAEVHAPTDAFLASLDEEGLNRQVVLPWGATVPVRWIIWHVLEHEIHHRGEVYLMLGLMGMEAPDV